MVKVLLFYFLVCSVCWILVAIIHITENIKNNSILDENDDVKDIKAESESTLADKIKSETDIYHKEEIDRKYRRVMDDIKKRSKNGFYDLIYCVMTEADLYEYVVQNKKLFNNNGFHVKHIENCYGVFDMSTVMISWR